MAPKKEPLPLATAEQVYTSLESADTAQRLSAIITLLSTGFPEEDIIQSGIPAKLSELVLDPDKSIKLAACKALATYAASQGTLKAAVTTTAHVQALWCILAEYEANEASLSHAPPAVEPAPSGPISNSKVAPPAVKKAGKDDSEDVGPNKFLLEACLRGVLSLIAEDAMLSAFLADLDPSPVIRLLHHASPRIQMRACRLLLALLRTPHITHSAAEAGVVPALVNMIYSSTFSVQEIALKSLQRMATHSGAHHVLLEQSGILHTLMILLLEAHTAAVAQASAPVAAKPTKANTGGTNAAADAQKQAEVSTLQGLAARLLALLCQQNSSLSNALLNTGGLQALLALLPDAVSEEAASVAAGSSSDPGGAGVEVAGAAAAAATTGRHGGNGANAAAESSSDSSPTDGKPQNGSSHYPISKAPVTCPEVHGNILEVLAAVASYPELARVLLGEPALPASLAEASERDSVQERFSGAGLDTQQAAHGSGSGSGHSPNQQQSTTADQGGSVAPDHAVSGDAAASGKQQQHPWQPRLMRMLLNFFTAPPPPPPPPPVVATPPEQPVPLPAVVEPAKAAGPASRSSGGGGAAAKGAKKPAAAEPAAAPATTSTSHAAKDAEKGKAAVLDTVPPVHPTLLPPFAVCVKRAALRCLAELCRTTSSLPAALHKEQHMLKQLFVDLESMDSQQAAELAIEAALLMSCFSQQMTQDEASQLGLVTVLKHLAKAVYAHGSSQAQCQVARAIMTLPEQQFVAPARPPVASPPPTPPPPPLPLSLFAWDVLGRPMVTDGMTLLAAHGSGRSTRYNGLAYPV
eukprot:jgi/Chrzof1/13367/Cz07g30120.t1